MSVVLASALMRISTRALVFVWWWANVTCRGEVRRSRYKALLLSLGVALWDTDEGRDGRGELLRSSAQEEAKAP